MKKSFLVILAIFLSIAVGFTFDTLKSDAKAKNNVIKYVEQGDPQTFDLAKMTGVPEFTIANAIFEGLIRYDQKGKVAPGIAEKWEVSADGKTYTFHLRKAKWSDGTLITAKDFKYAWLRALSPEIASEYAYQMFYIKGAEDYNAKKAKAEDVGITVVNDKTLKVQLVAPAPEFIGLTAFQTYLPLNEKSVKANPDFKAGDGKKIVSNGPFVMVSYKQKQKIIFKKNPNYWDAKSVKLDGLEYLLIEDNKTGLTMFENGEADVLVDTIPVQDIQRFKKDSRFKVYPQLGSYFYRFNTTRKPFNDVRVRKALSMSIDRNIIVNFITQAGQKPALAFVPYGMVDANGKDFRANGGNYFKEDLNKAKKLLADAGYPNGKGFPEISVLYNTNERHKKIAEAIQQMWKKNLGIQVKLVNQEWQVYLDMEDKLNYDVCRAGWQADYSDPMTFMDMFVTIDYKTNPNGGNNDTGWGNKKYDALIERAKSTNDVKVRMKAMHDAEKILMDEMPIMPIFLYTAPAVISKRCKNVVIPSFGPYAEFKWASVK